jgi:hypothetical protein
LLLAALAVVWVDLTPEELAVAAAALAALEQEHR